MTQKIVTCLPRLLLILLLIYKGREVEVSLLGATTQSEHAACNAFGGSTPALPGTQAASPCKCVLRRGGGPLNYADSDPLHSSQVSS